LCPHLISAFIDSYSPNWAVTGKRRDPAADGRPDHFPEYKADLLPDESGNLSSLHLSLPKTLAECDTEALS
jgi:hypothetical protein